MKIFKHAETVATALMLFAAIGSGCGDSHENELTEGNKQKDEQIKTLTARIQALSDEKTDLALQKANVEKTNSGLKIAIPLVVILALLGGTAIGLKAKKDDGKKQKRGEN